jgi:hypothetical protein
VENNIILEGVGSNLSLPLGIDLSKETKQFGLTNQDLHQHKSGASRKDGKGNQQLIYAFN